MADPGWRTDPHIQQAKRACVDSGSTAAILLLIDDRAGTVRLATYGIDGPRCTVTGKVGDVAYNAVMDYLDPKPSGRKRL